MSEDAAPERIAVNWSPEARADLRAIETKVPVRMRIRQRVEQHAIDHREHGDSGEAGRLKERPDRITYVLPLGQHLDVLFQGDDDENGVAAIQWRCRARSRYRCVDESARR